MKTFIYIYAIVTIAWWCIGILDMYTRGEIRKSDVLTFILMSIPVLNLVLTCAVIFRAISILMDEDTILWKRKK